MSYFVLVGGSMFAEKGVFGVVQRDNSETERDCRGGGGVRNGLRNKRGLGSVPMRMALM